MTCPHCASRAPPGAARCPSCGAPLLLPDDPAPGPLELDVELDASVPAGWAPLEVTSASAPARVGEDVRGGDDAWVRPGAGLGAPLPAAAFEAALDAEGGAAPHFEGALTPDLDDGPDPELEDGPEPDLQARPDPVLPPRSGARRGASAETAAAAAIGAATAGGAGGFAGPAALEDLDGGGARAAGATGIREPPCAGAPLALRLRAFLVDAACVLSATVLPVLLAARGLPAGVDALAAVGPPALGLVALAAFTYSVVAQATLGATPGQRLLGLRVTRLDGGALGFGEAALRAALAVAGTAAFGVGLLPALRGGRGSGRGLHDVVARTVVVLAP